MPARKITVIPNGLDTAELAFDPAARQRVREQFGITPDTYVIGSLGRFDRDERIDLLVQAAVPVLDERARSWSSAAARTRPGSRPRWPGWGWPTA